MFRSFDPDKARGRLTGLYEGIGTGTPLDTFAYNPDDTLSAKIIGSSGGTPTSTYGYDPIGWLASQSEVYPAYPAKNVGWTFNLNSASQIGSETRDNDAYAFPVSGASKAYSVNGLNQYTAVAGTAQTYDANGNLTGDGTNAYIYDGENRLVSGTAAGVTATLTYDPLGRLWQVVKGAANTRFLTDGDALVGEYNSAGTLTNRYVHGSNAAADDPLVWYVGAGLTAKRYLHADHLGSIVAATNTSVAPSLNAYDEYGVPAAANVGRFQYTGQIWLSELGLYYYKARMYSAGGGRFLQTDPVGYRDQFNLYAYVGDDPVNAIDPTGTEAPCSTLNTGCGIDPEQAGKGLETLYELSGAKDVVDFLKHPSVRTGFWAALAVAPFGRLEKPLAVIGHYPGYKILGEKLEARIFNVPPSVWEKMTAAEQWAANQKFLDRQIADRATFRLSTPANEARPGSPFAREVQHLKDKGYQVSKDGRTMTPPKEVCIGSRIPGAGICG